MGIGPNTKGRDFNFFKRLTVVSTSFSSEPDVFINSGEFQSLSLILGGTVPIWFSYNGNTIHGDMEPNSITSCLSLTDASANKLWFKLKYDGYSDLRIETNSSAMGMIPIGSVISTGADQGLPNTMANAWPVLLSDGTNLLGMPAHPVRTDPTGTTIQPVNGTITANIGTSGSLALASNQATEISHLGNIDGYTQLISGYTQSIDSKVSTASNQVLEISHLTNIDGYTKHLDNIFTDSPILDAFGRIRISNSITKFDSKFLFSERVRLWSVSTAVSGTSTWDGYRASVAMAVTSTPGSQCIRQTFQRFNYVSGKSLLFINTFVMGETPVGVIKRVGYFDGYNGIFLENNGGTPRFVIRSNVSHTPTDGYVVQTNWNLDKMDGYGPSGIVLDITKAQIFVTDFQWLGTGRVRCGFNINGRDYVCHEFRHANTLTSVYMSSPNLPMRYEITNVSSGSTSTLEQICSTVIIEGEENQTSFTATADRGVSPLTSVDNVHLYPLISIRIDPTKYGSHINITDAEIWCTTANAVYRWALVINPTINSTDSASWMPVLNASSTVQYDISRTLTNYISGGSLIKSGYGIDNVKVAIATLINLSLGIGLNGHSDELVLCIQKMDASTDSFVGAISWGENI